MLKEKKYTEEELKILNSVGWNITLFIVAAFIFLMVYVFVCHEIRCYDKLMQEQAAVRRKSGRY